MNCPHCHATHCVKNGTSRHGHQRWRCQACHKTFGDKDRPLGGPRKEGRRFGAVSGGGGPTGDGTAPRRQPQLHYQLGEAGSVRPSLETDARRKVEWVEADELWTYIAKKKMLAGSGGLLIVLPNRSWAGRWGIVEPKRPSGWRRNCLTPPRSSLPPTSGTPTRKSSAVKTMFRAKRTP